MADVENAYDQILDFLNNTTEKTLLMCGIAAYQEDLRIQEQRSGFM